MQIALDFVKSCRKTPIFDISSGTIRDFLVIAAFRSDPVSYYRLSRFTSSACTLSLCGTYKKRSPQRKPLFVTRKISAPSSASFAACNFVAIIINAIRTKSHCVCKGEISARNGCDNVFIRAVYNSVFHIRSFLYCKYTPGCPFCQQQLAWVF